MQMVIILDLFSYSYKIYTNKQISTLRNDDSQSQKSWNRFQSIKISIRPEPTLIKLIIKTKYLKSRLKKKWGECFR